VRAGDVAELSVGSKRWILTPVSAGQARYAAPDPPLTTLWVTGERATLVVKGQKWQECTVAPFRARGNEPGWLLEIGANMRFESGERQLEARTPPLSGGAGAARYVALAQGEPIAVSVFERRCADSMSGMPHPHAVEVTAFGRTYRGCGGEPLALLQGAEWVVEAVAGAAPARSPVTLNFGADGRAYGQGPCNPYNAGYNLTGEGLGFSLDAAARKSCDPAVMRQESAYFDLLLRTQRFEIASDGALVLLTRGGQKITARANETP
jgi:heat shock protein HslJ